MSPASLHDVDDLAIPETGLASVLMVDDNPSNLLALDAVLSPLGHRLVPVTSGREALTELLKGDFAVILLDVQMAGMDGFETASLIKAHKRTASIPLIFITAYSRDAENIFAGYARGGVDYLLKPVDPDILRSKVAVFVELYLRGQTIRFQQAIIRQQELARLEARHERRFHHVLESMPLPVWGARVDGTLYFASRAWSTYSARNPRVGAPLVDREAVHPDDVRTLEFHWGLAVQRQLPFEIECRLRRHDGAYRWHAYRAVAEHGETGQVHGWIVTATDIDDHKRQDEERTRLLVLERGARADAERANAAKDTFLATVSHELQSPLNAIVGWAQLLSSGQVRPERIPAALETIKRNAFAQARLVEDLLDLSRVIFGKLKLCLEWTSIGTIVRSAVDGVRPAAEAKGITMNCSIDGDEAILADPARLQQVVTNLLVNAVKFNRSGGRVDVHVTQTPAAFDLSIRDTGVGIAAESLPHVFDRFHQVDLGVGVPVEGLGLGLAVVEQIVLLHGGKVGVKSDGIGEGATFRVSFPRSARASQLAKGGPPRQNSQSLREMPTLEGRTILVVDDEEDARLLLVEVLQGRGAVVVPVGSARAALEFLRDGSADAVISDIGMPEQDGYSLIRAIREGAGTSGRRLPAIALTAHAYEHDGRHALAEGFEMHLTKPFDPSELVKAICGVIHRDAVSEPNGTTYDSVERAAAQTATVGSS